MIGENDPVYIIGGDTGALPSSVSYRCASCGAKCWLAVTGQERAMRGATVLCLPCGMRKAEEDGQTPILPSPSALLRDLRGG